MTSPAAPLRLARGAGLASLVVALSGLAHGLGGGHVPPAALLLAVGALLLPACVLLTGRRVGATTAVALLAAGQAALHQVFAVTMRCSPSATLANLPLAHAGHGAAAHHCSVVQGAGEGRPMVVWHVVATLVTAALVAGAERGLWLLADLLAPLLVLVAAAPRVVVRAAAALPWGATPTVRPWHLRVPPPRRGPPSPSVLALRVLPV